MKLMVWCFVSDIHKVLTSWPCSFLSCLSWLHLFGWLSCLCGFSLCNHRCNLPSPSSHVKCFTCELTNLDSNAAGSKAFCNTKCVIPEAIFTSSRGVSHKWLCVCHQAENTYPSEAIILATVLPFFKAVFLLHSAYFTENCWAVPRTFE